MSDQPAEQIEELPARDDIENPDENVGDECEPDYDDSEEI